MKAESQSKKKTLTSENGGIRISRRTLLKGALYSGALASLGGFAPILRGFVPSDGLKDVPTGEWLTVACQGCTTWCSVQLYVVNGRAIKVRGHPESKIQKGAVCPRAHLIIQQIYDPDRVRRPMKRTNPKKGRNEDPGFVPIEWDEALDLIADRIMELRSNGESHKMLLTRGRYTHLNPLFYGSFPALIGSPNNISHSSICAEAEKFGPYYTEGLWNYRGYDLEHTKYLLVWGADPLSSNRGVSFTLREWGDLRNRAHVATVEPRLTATAAKADEWLPVKPGTDGALALAMAHVILTEGLWSREFVGDFVDGDNLFVSGKEVDPASFEEIHTHGLVTWWNNILKDATPEWAEKITDVTAEQTRRVAIGFGKAAPAAICWMGSGPNMHPRGAYASMAVHALNGLVGSTDSKGGTLAPNNPIYRRGFPSIEPFLDETARRGRANEKIDQRGRLELPSLKDGKSGGGVVTNNVADAILNKDPYDIKLYIAYFNNFTFSNPHVSRWEEALTQIPFSVHLTPYASEQSWFCDLVLPTPHQSGERWGWTVTMGHGYRTVNLMQKVLPPFVDSLNEETEFVWLLAEKLAGRGFTNLLDYCKTIRDPETDREPTSAAEFEMALLKHDLRDIWDPNYYKGGDRFEGWEHFKRVGVWNTEPVRYRSRWSNMPTKTGKFEFYSKTLKAALEGHATKHSSTVNEVLSVCNYLAKDEMAFMPHYEEPLVMGEESEYPFQLVDYKSRMNREGRSANCSYYHELKDIDMGDIPYHDVAKLNPVDAQKLGLKHGDSIELISPIGRIQCTLSVWEGVKPGTVAKSYGQGHWAYGRHASKVFGKVERGANINEIMPVEYERLSGSTAFYAFVRLRIEKA